MLIVAQDSNQMCNRLFVFAHAIACAAECHVQVMNLAFEPYAEHFATTSQDLFCRYPARPSRWPRDPATRYRLGRLVRRLMHSLAAGRLRRYRGGRIQVLRSGYISTLDDPSGTIRLDAPEVVQGLQRGQIFLLDGPLFRDPANFIRHAGQLRAYFTPLPLYRQHATDCVQTMRSTVDVTVGVHIRGGDYATFRQGRHYHAANQYLPLMRCLEEQLAGRKVGFLICSNEAQQREALASINVYFGTGHPVEDLYSLAQCDYIIGVPSTYSLWASFYGQVPLYVVDDINRLPVLSEFVVNCG